MSTLVAFCAPVNTLGMTLCEFPAVTLSNYYSLSAPGAGYVPASVMGTTIIV